MLKTKAFTGLRVRSVEILHSPRLNAFFSDTCAMQNTSAFKAVSAFHADSRKPRGGIFSSLDSKTLAYGRLLH